MMRQILFAGLGFAFGATLGTRVLAAEWSHEELRRFPAVEANQGVAVDATYFYAITNNAIGKYRKDTGERVAGWQEVKGGTIKHLNSGVVITGKLLCAHSNFPNRPEQSSREVWDCLTMRHEGSFPFKDPVGSLTWMDTWDESWYACFAHYKKTSDPARSQVVRYHAAGEEELAHWTFPPKLVERFGNYSASGGSFGPSGHLFVTGHDAKELYVMELKPGGGEMIWLDTIPITAAGQAFAWDRSRGNDGIFYSVSRKTKEVIVSCITRKSGSKSVKAESKPEKPDDPAPAKN